MPRSFTVVADLLQDTIDRSAKSQSDTDGELAWLRRRLANQHRDQQLRAKEIQEAGDKASHKPRELFKQHGDKIDVLGGKENTSLINLAGPQVPSSMSVLQLRRLLRAIGQPTVGIKAVLINRLNKAVDSGVVKSFVESSKGWKTDDPILCAGERRKREAMLALAEAILGSNKTIPIVVAPRQPLLETAACDRNSRSSSCSASGNPGPKLSGQEQDAVLAKIRSAAKSSASPEKELPFQDDDTPTTKGLRLKKEVEDRLQRQNQLLSAKKEPDPSSKPTSPSPCTPPFGRTPGQTTNTTNQTSPVVLTPPSALPTVPTTPAPIPSSPSPRTSPLVRTPGQQSTTTTNTTNQTSPIVSTPPSALPTVPTTPVSMPPTSPKRPAFTPPPPTFEAPRPAATLPVPGKSSPCATDSAKETPIKPDKPSQEDKASGDYVEASAASRPLPTGNVAKASAAVGVAVKGASKTVVPRGGVNKSTDPRTVSCSPARFQTPSTNTPARKANAFAKDSISTTGPSGLKVAAHKALHRVVAKPSAPSTPAKGISAPAGNSTTKDAFAKFRAMDSAKKGAVASSSKSRQTPGSKVKPGNNPTMPPPQSHKTDYNNFGFSKASASSQAKRGVQGAQAAASFRATQHALVEASATASRDKAMLAAEKEREKARAKAAAKKVAADEARREAQAAAEAKARDAAFKAAAERKAKQKAAEAAERKEIELKKRKEEEEKQAAVAEALRQAELGKKAEANAAANAAVSTTSVAMAIARKEDQAALAQKRAQQHKPPTPPRPASKAPPTPPRPSQQSGAPTPPPRPNSVQVHLQEKSSMAASSKTPAKSPFSSNPSSGESFQLAFAKKKEEIKERMDVLRQTGYASEVQQHHASQAQKHYAAPAPKAGPVVKAPIALKPTPAQSPAPVKSVPKEDRESYDDYEVEGAESESECGDDGEEQAQEIPEPQEPTDKSGIPDWARGQTLATLLDRQYGGPNPINPDTIFPEFFTCNLEHIFNTKKSKWDRTSSGNWHKDRLTVAEKLAYQRAMGFNN